MTEWWQGWFNGAATVIGTVLVILAIYEMRRVR